MKTMEGFPIEFRKRVLGVAMSAKLMFKMARKLLDPEAQTVYLGQSNSALCWDVWYVCQILLHSHAGRLYSDRDVSGDDKALMDTWLIFVRIR